MLIQKLLIFIYKIHFNHINQQYNNFGSQPSSRTAHHSRQHLRALKRRKKKKQRHYNRHKLPKIKRHLQKRAQLLDYDETKHKQHPSSKRRTQQRRKYRRSIRTRYNDTEESNMLSVFMTMATMYYAKAEVIATSPPTPSPSINLSTFWRSVGSVVLLIIIVGLYLIFSTSNGSDSSDSDTGGNRKKKVKTSDDLEDDLESGLGGGSAESNVSDSSSISDDDSDYNSDSDEDDEDVPKRLNRDTVKSFQFSNEVPNIIKFMKGHLRSASNTTIKKIIENGQVVAEFMADCGEVFIPGSPIDNMINKAKIAMSTKGTGGIYHIDEKDNITNLFDAKTGRSTNLRDRYEHGYDINEHKGKLEGVIVFDYDYASDKVIEKLEQYLQDIKNMEEINLDGTNVSELTLESTIELEEKRNMSIIPLLVINSVHSPLGELSNFGSKRESQPKIIEDDMVEIVTPTDEGFVYSYEPVKEEGDDETGANLKSEEVEEDCETGNAFKTEEGGAASRTEEKLGDEGDAVKSSNIFGIQGAVRAFYLNMSESILHVFLKNKGVSSSDAAAQNEHLQFGYVKTFVKDGDEEVKGALSQFIDALKKELQDVDCDKVDWLVNSYEIFCLSSWAPRIKHNVSSATCTIYDALLGRFKSKDEQWENVFVDTPSEAKGAKNAYDSENGYNENDRETARSVHDNRLKTMTTKSDFWIFDVCSEAYRDLSTSSFLSKAEGLGFEPFFKYLHMVALIYKKDGVVSVIIVHDPLCDIFRSSANSWISWKEVQHQAGKALTAHLLQAIVIIIQSKDSLGAPVKTCQSIWGNFLFAYCMRVYVLRNLHCHSMVATLFGKNMLCRYANLFDPQYHSLSASAYGDTKKIQSKGWRGSTGHDKDMQIPAKLLRLSSTMPKSESTLDVHNPTLHKAIDLLLNEDGSGYGKAQRDTDEVKSILDSFYSVYLLESGKTIYDTLFKIAEKKNNSKVTASIESWKNVDSGEGKEKSESEDGSDNGSDDGSANGSEDGSDNESDMMGFMGALKKYK